MSTRMQRACAAPFRHKTDNKANSVSVILSITLTGFAMSTKGSCCTFQALDQKQQQNNMSSWHIMVMQDTIASQQKRHHWDKRKRRYIQLQPKEEVKAGKRMKTESGAKAKGDDAPSGLYQKWAKAHKRRVATPGEEESGAAAAYSKNLANRYMSWCCLSFCRL